MNEKEFETKMEKEGTKVKNSVESMAGDGIAQLKAGYDEFKGTVKENVSEAAQTIKKEVNHGMKQYNNKAQEVANRLPFDLNHSIRKYPWVVISLGLVFGFMLGVLLKPSRQ
ncbi:MAG: hypothetical protein C0410_12370 [Anaerolinea sp.]|nr:hypothetical protein [Anaerolinea sp.]